MDVIATVHMSAS